MRHLWRTLGLWGCLLGAISCPGAQSASQEPDAASLCGNGWLDPGEQCDDGNNVTGDGCDADCTLCDNPNPEQCDNGEDDDNDGLTDLEDPECQGFPCGPRCFNEICGNGVDDDGDGLVDCHDGLCANEPHCQGLEDCTNGVDDDDDGLVDLDDTDCNNFPCGVMEICGNGVDDNGDALVDCDDPTCTGWCAEPVCGNDVVERGEWCDDGNVLGGDGCSADCTLE